MFYSSKNLFSKILIDLFFSLSLSLKVKCRMDRTSNRRSKVYSVIITIEQQISIVNDWKWSVPNILEIPKSIICRFVLHSIFFDRLGRTGWSMWMSIRKKFIRCLGRIMYSTETNVFETFQMGSQTTSTNRSRTFTWSKRRRICLFFFCSFEYQMTEISFSADAIGRTHGKRKSIANSVEWTWFSHGTSAK